MRPGRAEHAAAFTAREGATVSRAMLSRAIANLPAAYPGQGLPSAGIGGGRAGRSSRDSEETIPAGRSPGCLQLKPQESRRGAVELAVGGQPALS